MIGINYELFDIYIYTHTHSKSTLKNFVWTKSLKLIKQPCDSPYYINWGFSLPINFLSSPITFFFFSWDIYGFTVGFSHTFTILYQLKFFFVGQLLIFTNNFFFFFWDIYGFTVGLSHTFTILYQLMFFSVGQLLIFTNNVFFFFFLGYIQFYSWP